MEWLPKWCDDIGFAVTVVGFAFTIIPLFMISSSVKKVVKRMNNNSHLADLSRSESVIDEVKRHFIENLKPDIELDKKVAQIKNSLLLCRVICGDQNKLIEQLIVRISNHQNLLNKSLLNPANKINSEELLNTLDEIRTIFAEAISTCKSKV